MKKLMLYIISILLLAIAVIGGTYAFYQSSSTTGNSAVSEDSSNFAVIYNPGDPISGHINIINDTDDDLKLKTTARIKMAPDSIDANAQLFINLEEITTNLINEEGLKWEIKGYINGSLKYSNKGNFAQINPSTSNNCTVSNDKITCPEGYKTICPAMRGSDTGRQMPADKWKGSW